MLKLAAAVALIALPDSVNPSLILTELFLAGGQRPGLRTAMFSLAAFAVTFAGGIAIALGLGDLVLSLVPKPSAAVKNAFFVVAGLVVIAGGVALWIHRRGTASRAAPKSPNGPAALLGAGIAGVELLTAFPYFAAIAMVVSADVSDGQKVSLLALYNVVYALPLIAIAVVCAVGGPQAQRTLGPIADWILRRWPSIVAPLAGLVGCGLVVYGTARLVA